MTNSLPVRKSILRAHAFYLLVTSTLGLVMDVAGIFFSRGPERNVLAGTPFPASGS